jgi:hypothetical protein
MNIGEKQLSAVHFGNYAGRRKTRSMASVITQLAPAKSSFNNFRGKSVMVVAF